MSQLGDELANACTSNAGNKKMVISPKRYFFGLPSISLNNAIDNSSDPRLPTQG